MKKLLAIALMLTATIGYSQTATEEIDYYQSIFGMGKKEVVAELIEIKADKAESFWMLYDQYETSRKELGKKRIELLANYANGYGDLNEDELKKLMMESMSLSAQTEKLIKSYYKKVEKEVGAVSAAQFYQVETYLLSEIRVAIWGNIPMVEKIKKD